MEFYVVFATASSLKEARNLSHALLGGKLAACVNIIEKIESSYWWKGKIERSKESLLIIKTEKKQLQLLIRKIKELHSYSVPEIIACPIAGGNPDYLNWIRDSLKITEGKGGLK